MSQFSHYREWPLQCLVKLQRHVIFVVNIDELGFRMCKKMKAIYYLPNYSLDTCMNLYSNQYLFSEIDETNLWCDPGRYGTLMGLMFGIS